MKIKNGFTLKKVMGSYMIVSTTDESFNNVQTMNETGAFLWELLKEDTTIDSMSQKVAEEYEIDEETAKRDIEAFVDKLKSAGLID